MITYPYSIFSAVSKFFIILIKLGVIILIKVPPYNIMTKVEHQSKFEFTQDTPYLTLNPMEAYYE